MIPAQRALVKKLAGQPFTLLGINSDGDRSGLPQKLKESEVTWPQLHEGRERAISQRWNIHSYPTLFVIDQQGVIRQRGYLPEEEVEKAVSELLAAKP